MKIVVGLGNPGAEYQNTRHNIGFLVVDRLAEELKIRIGRRAFKSLVGEGQYDGEAVLLVKPQTYMNLSGAAVRDALRFYRLSSSDLLVIYDDVNLELGRLRLRTSGSAGGHNGMKSIIAEVGEEFPRLRVGVGHPGGSDGLIDHVLGKWEREEIPIVRDQVEKAAEAALHALREGIEPAMNRYNAK